MSSKPQYTIHINTDWLVIGGGLGGICGIARLLELYLDSSYFQQVDSIQPSIMWVDADNFQAGDLRKRYGTVSSNTEVKNFIFFFNRLEEMGVYPFSTRFNHFDFNRSDPDKPCLLKIFTDQLLDVTQYWLETYSFILAIEGVVKKIRPIDSGLYSFSISTKYLSLNKFQTKNIILAPGCDPKIPPRVGCLRTHDFMDNINIIPLSDALDPVRLSKWYHILEPKNILVFGNAHSGVLVLKNLENLEKPSDSLHIYNVVKHPIIYPLEISVDTESGNKKVELYDKTGIRGIALRWAKENLQPRNRTSIKILNLNENLDQIEQLLSSTDTVVIFATGFQPRYIDIQSPNNSDKSLDPESLSIRPCYHNEKNQFTFNVDTGMLAPNVYGLGLAFPETEYHHNIYECNVGLNEFLDYARKTINHV